jgi:hypothetical protein
LKITTSRISLLLILVLIVNVLGYGCSRAAPAPGRETLVFQDDLSNPNSGWFVYKAGETKGGKYDKGFYSVWSHAQDTVLVLNPKLRKQYDNFIVEVDVQRTSEETGTLLGIIYRLDDAGHYYRFCISDNQTYYVTSRINGIDQQLNLSETSSSIKPVTEINRLKLVCDGTIQDLYVNGNKLDSVTDNTSLTGEMGLAFINLSPTASYTFTNFKLSKIE